MYHCVTALSLYTDVLIYFQRVVFLLRFPLSFPISTITKFHLYLMVLETCCFTIFCFIFLSKGQLQYFILTFQNMYNMYNTNSKICIKKLLIIYNPKSRDVICYIIPRM